MVQFDPQAKDRLVEATNPQTFGRLLLKVVDSANVSLAQLGTDAVDSTDSRFYLYEWAREHRELMLQILIFSRFQSLLPAIDKVVHVANDVSVVREDVRKRGMELFEAQWPPLGTLPTPTPVFAVEAATDVLAGGNYLRLPKLTALAVKQTDSLEVDAKVELSPEEKSSALRRVREEARLNWLLSKAPKDRMSFNMVSESPVEYAAT